MNFELPFPELYSVILETIQSSTQVYLVGGCVRDLLLGRVPQDIDLALSADVRKVSRTIANHFNGAVFSLDDERQTMRVIINKENRNWKLDIALLRGGSLEEDLRTRDFTINAMALEILSDGQSRLIDVLSSQNDLANGLVRPCNESSILDDPIRILRGTRLALSLDFELSNDSEPQMVKAVDQIEQVSGERQRDELFKLLELDNSSMAFSIYQSLGIFQKLFPKFTEKELSVLERLDIILSQSNTEVINSYLSNSLVEDRMIKGLLKISVLISTDVEDVCGYYALSNREKVFLEHVQSGILVLKDAGVLEKDFTSREIYRYYRLASDAGVGACLVFLADSNTEVLRSNDLPLIRAYFGEYDRYIGVKPLLDGNDLIRSFHLQPGPKFKNLLESLKEAQAVGNVTSKTEAEQFIRGQLD